MSELLTTARPYAKALFEIAKDKSMLNEYFYMLKNLKILISEDQIKNILENNSFNKSYKLNILADILKDGLDENFLRFIRLLIENNRLFSISEIIALYDSYSQAEKNLKIARVDTAFELNSEQIKEIKIALEKKFNTKIEINQNQDSTLLAGAVIRVDDLVIDGSIKEQLRKLESQLI